MTTFNTRVSFDHVRNTAAGFTTANPVLGYGVIGLETDSGKIKVGNGTTAWASLPYSGGGPVEWSAIAGKPSTFTPATHTHAIADVTGLQTALDAKATPADVTAAVSSVIDAAPAALDTLNELAAALGDDASFASTMTTALSAKAPLASPTFTGTVSGVTKAMVGLGNVDNTSDASKPISTATQTALDAKAAATHTHVIANVTGLQTALDGKQAAGSYAATVHTHAIADVTGLQTALDGKAASSHTHTSAAITDFTTAVQAAAPATTNASLLTSGTLADARLSSSVVLTGDARLSDARTPTAHSHGLISNAGVLGAGVYSAAGPVVFDSTFGMVCRGEFGSVVGTVCQGNDARLSDARTPTDGSVTDAKIATAGLSASSVNWTAVAAWAPSTAYAKGALVHYLGIAYRRSVAGTSGSTFSASNWQQMTAPVNVTVTPSQITSNQNDYALGGQIATADIFRVSSDAARNITGITAGLYDGHAILLRNVGSFAITLTHQDAASSAANRMISPWAGNVVISANSSMLLMYDNTLSRWVVT